jgi:transposase
MLAVDQPHAPAAIRTDLGAISVSMELSKSTWLITSLSPGAGERMSKHVVRAGDVAGLMERFALLREKARVRTGQEFGFIVIQEPGRVLDPPRVGARRYRELCRRPGIDCDIAPTPSC